VTAQVLQLLLALTAAIWHNHRTNQPVPRSLLAYDHQPPASVEQWGPRVVVVAWVGHVVTASQLAAATAPLWP
jgi:hypothetical protein